MKRHKLFIGIIAVIVILFGAAILLYQRNVRMADEQNAAETARMNELKQQADESNEKSGVNADMNVEPVKGSYVDYSDGSIKASKTRNVLLFFHAPWCGQCRMIDGDIKEQGVPDDTTVIKVDYDSHQDLRQKYGVTLQTTFVKIDKNGDTVQKYVAYNEPTFDSVKRNLLQ